MTATANNLVRKHEKFRRFLTIVRARLQTLDYTTYDHTQDRIDRLERKITGLTEELRQSRASGPRFGSDSKSSGSGGA
jgi:polyhydroxyalkanoate synthesis regulator phasin